MCMCASFVVVKFRQRVCTYVEKRGRVRERRIHECLMLFELERTHPNNLTITNTVHKYYTTFMFDHKWYLLFLVGWLVTYHCRTRLFWIVVTDSTFVLESHVRYVSDRPRAWRGRTGSRKQHPLQTFSFPNANYR